MGKKPEPETSQLGYFNFLTKLEKTNKIIYSTYYPLFFSIPKAIHNLTVID
jgi:hypothetical protein